MVISTTSWFQWDEGRRDHFLNSQVGIVPSVSENLQSETNFSVGSALMTYSTKRMKEVFKVTCETKIAMIYDNQESKWCTWSEQGTH
jgi:hypothetical protein